MEIHNEVGTGLKASLLVFVLLLVGSLVYFVSRQNDDLIQIYAAQDLDALTAQRDGTPKSANTTTTVPQGE